MPGSSQICDAIPLVAQLFLFPHSLLGSVGSHGRLFLLSLSSFCNTKTTDLTCVVSDLCLSPDLTDLVT